MFRTFGKYSPKWNSEICVNMNPTKSKKKKKLHCCPEKIEATRILIFVIGTDKDLHFYDDNDV